MLPAELQARYGITVVPITITIDGRDYVEGVDLTTGEFYAQLGAGADVSTAAPSPGAFLDAYRAAVAAGATEVLSIHTGATYSATIAAATVAANLVDVIVEIVDTDAASFPVALAAWSAADVVAAGGSLADAADAARHTARHAGSFFVVGVPDVARRGGRFVTIDGELTPTTVLSLRDGQLDQYANVPDLDAAIDTIVDATLRLADKRQLRIGVGHAVHPELATLIASRLRNSRNITELTVYEVGPSVGAHTGPGTFGVVYTDAR